MNAKMKSLAQSGFTLIELIITIVIIGVLAAVAIPKFQDLTNDAEKGVGAGVAASIASGSSVNYGRSKVPGATPCTAVNTPAGCYAPIASCANLITYASMLADIPAGYTVTGTATIVVDGAAHAGCSVTGPNATVAPFNAYGA